MALSLFGIKASGLQRQHFVWTLMISIFKGTLLTLQRVLLIFIVSFLCLYVMTLARLNHPLLGHIQSFSYDVTFPIVNALNRPFDKLRAVYERYIATEALHKKALDLAEDNQFLLEWKTKALHLERENRLLRDLLRTLPVSENDFLTAKVLGSPAGEENATLVVSASSSSQIARNAPVLCASGLIGRIAEIGALVTRVMLLTDSASRTPVRFESTGEQAILAGQGTDELVIIHKKQVNELLEKQQSFKAYVGERLITSGFGGIYPPDLPVAHITRIEDDKIYARLFVKPQNLEYIRILTSLNTHDLFSSQAS
jgi:rod shape-determining protein MreC